MVSKRYNIVSGSEVSYLPGSIVSFEERVVGVSFYTYTLTHRQPLPSENVTWLGGSQELKYPRNTKQEVGLRTLNLNTLDRNPFMSESLTIQTPLRQNISVFLWPKPQSVSIQV